MPEDNSRYDDYLALSNAPYDPEPFLTLTEIAKMLGVHRSWVDVRVRRNAIPCLRVGRYPRFLWSEVSAWVASGAARCLRDADLAPMDSPLEVDQIAAGRDATESVAVDSIAAAQDRCWACEGDPS